MERFGFERAKKAFDKEVSDNAQKIIKENDDEEIKKRLALIRAKELHTMEVVNDGTKVMNALGFNNNVTAFGKIVLLDHDIGRFAQMRLTGSYNDALLGKVIPVKHHGELGDIILSTVLPKQLPKSTIYYVPIKKIVRNHVNARASYTDLSILSTDVFKNNSMHELLVGNDYSSKIINTLTQIVQDVDRLDIYHQILDGRWEPKKEDEPISPVVIDSFYKGEYLDMDSLKRKGLWNANVGDLLRLGFINDIRLLSVAKLIKEEDLIMKMKLIRNNPYVDDAFDFANDKLNKMIENSIDGIVTGRSK